MSDAPSEKRFWTVRTSLWVIAAHLAVLPFAIYALSYLDTENDIASWLPADDPQAIVLAWFVDQFGLEDGLLASWDGSTLNDPRMERFAAALAGPINADGERHDPLPGIKGVRTPHDLIRRMIEQKVDRSEAVQRIQGTLVGTGPMKIRLTDAGRAERDSVIEQITDAARDDWDVGIEVLLPAIDEHRPSGVNEDAEQDEDEPGFEANEFSAPRADDPYPAASPHDFQLRWNDMVPQSRAAQGIETFAESLKTPEGQPLVEEAFYEVGAPVAIGIVLTEEGSENVDATIDMIRQTALDSGIPEEALHMGGAPVGRSALNRASGTASWNTAYPVWNLPMRSPLMTSALVGLVTAFLVLKSVRLALLVIVTALYVATLATSLVPATGKSLNMVLLVMPNLLIVLTTSGAIHVANYWRHAAMQQPQGAIETAVRMAWQPCLLASVTTAIGLSSLMASVLSPVREFGMFSAIGCIISLVAVLWGFPALLGLWRKDAPSATAADTSKWRQFGHWIFRHGRAVSLTCLAVVIVATAGLRHFRSETKVIKYFPEHSRIMSDYRFLEENLAGIVPIEMVIAFDRTAREGSDDAGGKALDSVQRLELVRQVEARIAEHREISGTLSLADFRPQLAPPVGRSMLLRRRYNETVRGLDDYLEAGQDETGDGMTATAKRPLYLAAHVRGGGLIDIPQGTELWRIRAQVAVLSDLDYGVLIEDLEEIMTKALAGQPGASYLVTGTVPLFLRTQNAVLESLIRSFALAFAIIAVVMMVLLRSPSAGLLTMLPNLAPVGAVFGLISWFGVPVDIGTMITASVALGIAVDGTLHLLTWFRDGLKHGMTREDAISLGLAHCGPAMWQTSAAIGLSLLMLATTELLLISRFGWLMSSLIATALLADIVFLPALLAGPLGSLIERSLTPSILDVDDETAAVAESPTPSATDATPT